MKRTRQTSNVNAPRTELVDPRRSALMARVKSKGSKPELVVRKLAHGMGYRFRLHSPNLPGTPDLVFPGLKKIIFIHGCFWHRHRDCSRTTNPKTRAGFWSEKFKQNIKRDKMKETQLKALGWDVLIIWECQTFNRQRVSAKIDRFLSGHRRAVK